MAPPIPESDVLIPRDPSLDNNSDEWPEFTLTNATVHLPDDPEAVVSLLDAAQYYPVTVVGQLEPPAGTLAHLYKGPSTRKRVNIEVTDVRFFSYGQYPDGTIAIWAAGRAGWFTIQPSRAYRAIYAAMIEAVRTFYFITDVFKRPRRSGRGTGASSLSDQTLDGFFARYAAERMPATTSIFEASQHIYEHTDALLSFMIAGKEDIIWTKNPIYAHLTRKFPDAHVKIKQRIKGPSGKAPISAATLNAQVEYSDSSSVMSSSRTRNGRSLRNSRSVEPMAISAVATGHERPRPILRHTTSSGRRRGVADDTEPLIPAFSTPNKGSESDSDVPRRKGKSALRLRADPASKSIRRSGTKADSDESEDAERVQSPTGAKRKVRDIAGQQPRPKRRSSRPGLDEGIDMPSSPGEHSSAASPESPADSQEVDKDPSDSVDEGVQHQPNDPVQEDTWICALDGCRFKIYGVSKPDSQKLIKEHYELHAFDDDDRVRLVKRLQEPSLPAGHLMERVKMQAKMEGYSGSRLAVSRYPETVPIRGGVNQRY